MTTIYIHKDCDGDYLLSDADIEGAESVQGTCLPAEEVGDLTVFDAAKRQLIYGGVGDSGGKLSDFGEINVEDVQATFGPLVHVGTVEV